MNLTDLQQLYVKSMGKMLKVTALFMTDREANEYMEKNPDEAVVAIIGQIIVLANFYDKGV